MNSQNTILYYIDLQSTEFQVLNSIKSSFLIYQMYYIEKIDQILAWNNEQVILANPYTLNIQNQVIFQYINTINLIENTDFAIFDAYLIYYVYNYWGLYSSFFILSNQENVLLVQTTIGIQAWTFDLKSYDHEHYGYIQATFQNQQKQFVKHPNYDMIIICIVNGNNIQLQFIQIQSVVNSQYTSFYTQQYQSLQSPFQVIGMIVIPKNQNIPNSKDKLLVNYSVGILSIDMDFSLDEQKNIINTFFQINQINQTSSAWLYLSEQNYLILGYQFYAYLFDMKTQSSTQMLQQASDGNNRRYIFEYQNSQYYIYINPHGFIVTDRDYNNRRTFYKNNPPKPYVQLKHGTFFSVKGCELCYVLICNESGNKADPNNLYIATTLAFPINSTYQYISLSAHNIQINTMTYNLDPFFYNNQVWVAIGVSYTQNNLGCIFKLLNIQDQSQYFCLNSINPNDNQLQSMFAIASLKDTNSQEIVGIARNGIVFKWNLQNQVNTGRILIPNCYNSESGNMYHYVQSDQSIYKYFIAICETFQANILDLQTEQVKIIDFQMHAMSRVVSVFESIGIIAIGGNFEITYLFKYDHQNKQFTPFMQIGSQKLLEQVFFIQLVSQNTLWIQYTFRDLYLPLDSCLQDINNCLNCSLDYYYQVTENQQANKFYGLGTADQPFSSSNNLFTGILQAQLYTDNIIGVVNINANIIVSTDNVFEIKNQFLSFDFNQKISLQIKSLRDGDQAKVISLNQLQFYNYNFITFKDINIVFDLQNLQTSTCGLVFQNVQNIILDNISTTAQNLTIQQNFYLISVYNGFLQLLNYQLKNKILSQIPQLIHIQSSNQVLIQNFTLESCQFDPGFAIMYSESDIIFQGSQINILNNNTTFSIQNQRISSLFLAGQYNLTNININYNQFGNIKIFDSMPQQSQISYTFSFQNIKMLSNQFTLNNQNLLFSVLYTQLSQPDHNFFLSNGTFYNNNYISMNQLNSNTFAYSSSQKSFLIQTEKIKNIQIQNVNFSNHKEISFIQSQYSKQMNINQFNCFGTPSESQKLTTIAGCFQIQEIQNIQLVQLQVFGIISQDISLIILENKIYNDTIIQINKSNFTNLQMLQLLPSSNANPIQILTQQKSTVIFQNCVFQDIILNSPLSALTYSVTSIWVQNVLGSITIQQSQFYKSQSNSKYNNLYIQTQTLSLQNSIFDSFQVESKQKLILNQDSSNIITEGGFIRANVYDLQIQNISCSNSISFKGSFLYAESYGQGLSINISNSNFTEGYSVSDGSAFYFDVSNINFQMICSNCNFKNFFNFQSGSSVIAFSNQTQVQKTQQIQFNYGLIYNITGYQYGYFIKVNNQQLSFQNINTIKNEKQTQSFLHQDQSLIYSYKSFVNFLNSTLSNFFMRQINPLFINSYSSQITLQQTYLLDSEFSSTFISINKGQLNINNSSFTNINQINQPNNKRRILQVALSQSTQSNSLIQISNAILQINNNSTFNGILCIQNCQGSSLNIQESTFNIKNTSFSNLQATEGGAIYIENAIQNNIIKYCEFKNNTSIYDGGALNINSQSNNEFQLNIDSCNFTENQSLKGKGGAIYIYSETLNDNNQKIFVNNSNISNNKAEIGGGIQFQNNNPVIDDSNNLLNNKAKMYGQNTFSYPTRLHFVNQNDFLTKNPGSKMINDSKLIVQNFRSGQNLSSIYFQMTNDQNELVVPQTEEISYYVQVRISNQTANQINYQIRGQQQSKYIINTIPQLSLISFDQIQVIGIPGSIGIIEFYSDQIFRVDPQTNQLQPGSVFQIQINFRNCTAGEFISKYSNYQECINCPQDTYSFDPKVCLDCPSGAVCEPGKGLKCKEGFWRSSELDNQILECTYSKYNCVGGSYGNYVCRKGSIGALCQECDIYGKYWDQQYTKQNEQDNCIPCSQANEYLYKLILIQLFVIIYLAFIIQKNEENTQKQRVQNILTKYFQKKSNTQSSIQEVNQKNNFNLNKTEVYIKIFMNYIFIISALGTLKLNIPKCNFLIQIQFIQLIYFYNILKKYCCFLIFQLFHSIHQQVLLNVIQLAQKLRFLQFI
ncbi:transmembrane protein, putative (macronuclear) [Tetrahymena thermophila SB210]|uniref:Transmembrane protein, putative n=1 Tax=Tetrahymena thermophila (strain SB210) TaxID=312017 RepID=W7X892_TETTS|nr:transmembrane protein, putative [Tetrahymena thermophila SB210]EWS75590.1 transmembrane protein, putative [Tetrahymena thermophila SB210]|eukprot:XP_012651890.1 transmembrane protein, putative [Tetrahymena thermophila SB210]